MTLGEMKNTILFVYHKDIDYWWKLLGHMYEVTDGFTKNGRTNCVLDGWNCHVAWDGIWYIEESGSYRP